MGSLASRPKIPKTTQQVVYVPYTPSTPSTPTTDTGSSGGASDEQLAADFRTGSLLSRDRSRFGTISTSFRGLLDLAGGSAARKTLLGE